MKRGKFILICFTILLLFVGCGKQKGEAEVNLRLGHIQSAKDIWHKASLVFKEELEKRSDGKITATIYPSSTLGGDRDIVEGMQLGTIDMGLIAGVLGNFEPSIQLFEIPYLFTNEQEYTAIVKGEVGGIIADRLRERAGVRILDFWDRGPREVSSNKPINSLKDIQGLKIRIPEIQAMEAVWSAMGASPTTMAWGEVYTALEQNVIEAQENPVPFMYSGRIHEVQKYIAMTDHKFEYVTLSISEKTWQSLTEEQKKIVHEAADAATKYQNDTVNQVAQENLQEMIDAGMKITYPDKKEFQEAAKEASRIYGESVDADLYHKIIQDLEAMK